MAAYWLMGGIPVAFRTTVRSRPHMGFGIFRQPKGLDFDHGDISLLLSLNRIRKTLLQIRCRRIPTRFLLSGFALIIPKTNILSNENVQKSLISYDPFFD